MGIRMAEVEGFWSVSPGRGGGGKKIKDSDQQRKSRSLFFVSHSHRVCWVLFWRPTNGSTRNKAAFNVSALRAVDTCVFILAIVQCSCGKQGLREAAVSLSTVT